MTDAQEPVPAQDSILKSVKKIVGLGEDYTPFDLDIIMHINSVFMTLNQLGVGPDNFSIEDDTATWASFVGDQTLIQGVKTYVAMKVKLIFDPPATSFAIDSIQKLLAEYEFRLNVSVDPSQQRS